MTKEIIKIDDSWFYGADDFSDVPERPAKKANGWKGPLFTKLPRAWAVALANAKHAKTYTVAIHVLDLAWKEQARQKWAYEFKEGAGFPLANGALAELGVTRWQKQRALQELETSD
jgi:hypothetical protein